MSEMSVRSKLSVVLGAAVALSVLWPLRPGARDGFPLSTYPMFTTKREFVRQPSLVAVEQEEQSIALASPVPPTFVANDEVMLAAMTIRRAVAQGFPGMDRLCRDVAANIRKSDIKRWSHLLVIETAFDPVQYVRDGKLPVGAQRELYRCPIQETARVR